MEVWQRGVCVVVVDVCHPCASGPSGPIVRPLCVWTDRASAVCVGRPAERAASVCVDRSCGLCVC